MDTEIRLKGAGSRALKFALSVSLILVATSGLQAASVLWSNGAINTGASGDNRCDSGPNSCGSVAGWTIFDNFNVPVSSKPWVVSGFDFSDFVVSTPLADYKSTSWSIWNGDPLSGGKLVASGSAVAVPTLVNGVCGIGSTCLETFTVNLGANVLLASGSTYYLGTSNVWNSGADVSMRAFAAGGNTAPGGTANGLSKWEQSNGSTSGVVGSSWSTGGSDFTFPGNGVNEGATAFDINGTLVPEPGTITMLTVAIAGLCYFRRRRTV